MVAKKWVVDNVWKVVWVDNGASRLIKKKQLKYEKSVQVVPVYFFYNYLKKTIV